MFHSLLLKRNSNTEKSSTISVIHDFSHLRFQSSTISVITIPNSLHQMVPIDVGLKLLSEVF
jgi:hypothetical protein